MITTANIILVAIGSLITSLVCYKILEIKKLKQETEALEDNKLMAKFITKLMNNPNDVSNVIGTRWFELRIPRHIWFTLSEEVKEEVLKRTQFLKIF